MSEPTNNHPLAVRFYAWLIQLYPQDFRAKFGHEMLQTFGDRWRDELDQANAFQKLAFWAEVIFDFLTTAPFEYFTQGESMDTVERDLRWDLRYGVQLFLRHSAIALKYAAWAGILLLGLYTIAIAAVALYSSMQARQMEGTVNRTWKKAIGLTPQESYESILKRYPKSEKNKSATEVEKIAYQLGVESPKSGVKWGSQAPGRMGPFGTYDAPPFLYAQLAKPFDEIDLPPLNVQEFLNTHRSDLDALYNLVLQNEAPQWEIDIQKGFRAPVPNFFFHHQLQAIIALDILEQTRCDEHKKALEAFKASWKISQSLRGRPEMISQYNSLQVLNRQADVLRKMKEVPTEWQQHISQLRLFDLMLQSLELDVNVVAQFLAVTNETIPGTRWDNLFLATPFSSSLRRLIALENLELTGVALTEFQEDGFCDFDPNSFKQAIESKTSRWRFGKGLYTLSYLRFFGETIRTFINLELTQKILQTRGEFANLKPIRTDLEGIRLKSSVCSKASWIREISPEGTVHISVIGIPEWMKAEDRLLRIPLEYSLQI